MTIDVEALKPWIGKTETKSEAISPALAERFHATTGLRFDDMKGTPHGIHWCLAQPAANWDEVGTDGHPKRGGFLPPVPLPNRMWAASKLIFHHPLMIGDNVTRSSKIADISLKSGRSGDLCFVTVNHQIFVEDELRIEEDQTIVYRGSSKPGKTPEPDKDEGFEIEKLSQPMDEVLLFRYSALTFNGHRIHYDHQYVTQEEGYPGLIVHGPLQATLLMGFAQRQTESPLQTFSFRGVSPMFAGPAFTMKGKLEEAGISVKSVKDDGITAMKAEATW